MAEITLYTTPYCPYCIAARQMLDGKGADYTVIDVASDAEARTTMTQRAMGRRTVPQIFIGQTHVGGFDDMAALERAGKLDALLQN